MTSDLSMLTADERSLARRYRLGEYFTQNNNHLMFIAEMKKIIGKRYKGFSQADWARSKCVDLAQTFLEHSDRLFHYVNDIYAGCRRFKNVSAEDWKRICSVSSKIIVYSGWKYEAKQ